MAYIQRERLQGITLMHRCMLCPPSPAPQTHNSRDQNIREHQGKHNSPQKHRLARER